MCPLLLTEDSYIKTENFHCHLNGSAKLNVSDSVGHCQFVQFCAAWEKKGRTFQVGLP